MSLSDRFRRWRARGQGTEHSSPAAVETAETPVRPPLAGWDADWFDRSLTQNASAGQEVDTQGETLSEAGSDWFDPLAPACRNSDEDGLEEGHEVPSLAEASDPVAGLSIFEDIEPLADLEPVPASSEGGQNGLGETWIDHDEPSTPAAIDIGGEDFDFYPEDVSIAPPPTQDSRQLASKPDYPDAGEYRIRVDAALLADAFCGGVSSRRPAVADRLRAILRDFPHASSRQAIEWLATTGLDLSTLEELTDLKRLWRDDPGFWVMRRPAGFVLQSSRLRYALSWQLALRLHRAWPSDACAMMGDELLGRWLALPSRRADAADRRSLAYLSFTSWLGGGGRGNHRAGRCPGPPLRALVGLAGTR